MNKLYLLFVIFLFEGIQLSAQEFEYARFRTKYGYLDYRVLLPQNFDDSVPTKYPVVFFLHGSGERGNDNEKQLVHGSSLFLNNIKDYPAIVIFPQCSKDDYWANVNREKIEGKTHFEFKKGGKPTQAMKVLIQLVDSVSNSTHVDHHRIYVGGLSMGGMGTFELVNRRNKVFAAAFTICGAANPSISKKISKNTSFWIFHGAQDDVVPSEYSEKMVAAINEYGGAVKFTLYPKANHNSWDLAFAEPGLLDWVFSKKLN